jgi:8-oxo-dGTP pyrophosphatase MutT (NUDIX family)
MIRKFDKFLERLYWGHQAAGILPYCKKTKRFLVGLRSANVKEPHTWGTFGGAINYEEDTDDVHDNSLDDGAIREFREETGYEGKIEIVKGYVFKDGDFTYTNYIGYVNDEFVPILNWENEKAEWLTLDELNDLNDKHFGLIAFMKNSKEFFK